MTGKIISAFSHKGGVGKTNFIYNLGFALSDLGKTVLFVDADSQMNLSSYVFGKAHTINYGDAQTDLEFDDIEKRQIALGEDWKAFCKNYRNFAEHFNSYASGMKNEKPLYVSKINKNISLLSGSIDLSSSELEWTDIILGSRTKNQQTKDLRPYYFEKSIKDLALDFDYVLIDTPPSSSSVITGLSVMSSDYFIVPTAPSFFSLQAIDNLLDIFKNWLDVFESHRQTPNIYGLSLQPKLLGTVMQKSRIFTRYQKAKNQYSDATNDWIEKINSRLDIFYNYAIRYNYTIEKEQFKKIFINSHPLIIDNICDFTLELSRVAEQNGVPIIHLTTKQCAYLSDKNNNYTKAYQSFSDAYKYIATCLSNL